MGRPRKPLRSFGPPWVRIPLLPLSGVSRFPDVHRRSRNVLVEALSFPGVHRRSWSVTVLVCVPRAPVAVPHSGHGGGDATKPTGKRVSTRRRHASSSSTRPATAPAASSTFPSGARPCRRARPRHDERTGGRPTGIRCPGSSARCTHRPATRSFTAGHTVADADGRAALEALAADSTVAAFADWWLTTYAPRLRFGSVDKYRERLDRLGPLAELAIGDVTAEQVADWQTWLLTHATLERSPPGSQDGRGHPHHGPPDVLRRVDLELIRTNPVDRVKPPKVKRSPGRVLARDEVARLIDETDRHRYGAVVAIMFTVGLRVSEVLGLAWSDIDLDAGTAHVRRAVVDGEWPNVRPDQDRWRHGCAPPRRRHRRTAASVEARAGGGTSRGRAAVANPHLRVGSRSIRCSPNPMAGSSPANRSTSCCVAPPKRSGSTRPASAPTSAAAPSSPRSTPPAPTSVTSPATSAMPARRPPPATWPVSAIVR